MEVGKCSSCHSPLDGSHKSYCRYCFSHYTREARKRSEIVRLKTIARTSAKRALKKGLIIKENCKLCGSKNSEMHHPDYSKPNDVSWLCEKCHNEFHVLERRVLCA